jgi:hypothetical protein
MPIEETPAGHCWAAEAGKGNSAAAMQLASAYDRVTNAGEAAQVDVFGREVEWYRRAASLGVPLANLKLMQILDRDPTRQMPDGVLNYAVLATQAGFPEAAKGIARAYAAGRIRPEKLHFIRQWLEGPEARHSPFSKTLCAALDHPAPFLLPS